MSGLALVVKWRRVWHPVASEWILSRNFAKNASGSGLEMLRNTWLHEGNCCELLWSFFGIYNDNNTKIMLNQASMNSSEKNVVHYIISFLSGENKMRDAWCSSQPAEGNWNIQLCLQTVASLDSRPSESSLVSLFPLLAGMGKGIHPYWGWSLESHLGLSSGEICRGAPWAGGH